MAQKILDDQKYEPKKEDFIDKIPETIPEGNVNRHERASSMCSSTAIARESLKLTIEKSQFVGLFSEDETVGKEPEKDKASSESTLTAVRFETCSVFDLDADLSRGPPSISPIPTDEEVLPPAGIEQQTFVEQARAETARINDLMKLVASLYNVEPILIDLNAESAEKLKTADEICQEAHDALESKCSTSVERD